MAQDRGDRNERMNLLAVRPWVRIVPGTDSSRVRWKIVREWDTKTAPFMLLM